MSLHFDDVTDIYGSPYDIYREQKYEQNIQQLPQAYKTRYIQNFRFSDIGRVVDYYGDTVRDFQQAIGDEELDTELQNKVFVPPIKMAVWKKALAVNILDVMFAGQPKEVIDYVNSQLAKVDEMEREGLIQGLELGEISGWWDSITHTVGGIVKGAGQVLGNAGKAIVGAGKAVASGATAAGKAVVGAGKAVLKLQGKIIKGALEIGKKAAGVIVGGLKWMADRVKEVGTKLFNAITQKDKAKRELAKWWQNIKNFDDTTKKDMKSKNPKLVSLAVHYTPKVKQDMLEYNKTAKKLGEQAKKLKTYKQSYDKAKQKAPLTATASVKNAKKVLAKKGLKTGQIRGAAKPPATSGGIHGIDEDYEIEDMGFVVTATVAAVAIAAAAVAIAAIIAFILSRNTQTKKEWNNYQHTKQNIVKESGDYDVIKTNYDPSTMPYKEPITVTDPTTGNKVQGERIGDKVILPKHTITKTSTDTTSKSSGKESTTSTSSFGDLLKYGIIAAAVIGGLYVAGSLAISARRKE